MELLNKKYPKKRALITGAASGLGRSFAMLLSKNNWDLHLADVNMTALSAMSTALHEARSMQCYELDVSDEGAYRHTIDRVIAQSEHLDLLINNAGIGDGELFESYAADHWKKMIQVNLMGVYHGLHHVVPLMLAQQCGLIINIGSAAGFMNAPGMSAYNVSKAGVYALSETLYHEYKSRGVHVCVATPTFFKTNILSQAAGSAQFVAFAQKQMKYATTTADEMAEIILSKASKGKFHILDPREAKRAYFLKKWAPGLVSRQFQKMMKKFLRKKPRS